MFMQLLDICTKSPNRHTGSRNPYMFEPNPCPGILGHEIIGIIEHSKSNGWTCDRSDLLGTRVDAVHDLAREGGEGLDVEGELPTRAERIEQ